ncbi:MAG: response regulator, partial [Gammaproteobacteria bacterium]|nr:response regulator [Gammaproteobacteria bacterium]
MSAPASHRLLMIDDDENLSAMLAEYLAPMGMELHACTHAQIGLERLAAEHFDALVLDIMLPDVDGLEVCRRVRAISDIP